MGCSCSVGPRLKDARLWEGSEGQPSARELLSWHLRMDVETGADSSSAAVWGRRVPKDRQTWLPWLGRFITRVVMGHMAVYSLTPGPGSGEGR